MRHITLAGLLLSIGLCLPSCAYFGHLGKETAETFHIGVALSSGDKALLPLALELHALLPLGLGIALGGGVEGPARSWSFGSDFGYAFTWNQDVDAVVVGSLERWRSGEDDPFVEQGYFAFVFSESDTRDRYMVPTRLEVGVHLFVVGFSIGLDILELLDTLAAIPTLDLLGDDDQIPWDRTNSPPDRATDAPP